MTTHKRYFNKPPTTIKQQIALLKSSGLQIQNENLATHSLQFIGYYRLLGYMHSFRTHNKIYTKGTTFEDIVDHYIFDKKVRTLLFDAIEPIEIALRSAITSVMTEHYGAFWFTKKELFVTHIGTKPIDGAQIALKAIRESTIEQKNKDIFLKHYYDTYASPELPPSWIVMETMSMGTVSRIFSLLNVKERKEVALLFSIKERHLVSWMRSLTYTRNL